jgi:hypothetical protein
MLSLSQKVSSPSLVEILELSSPIVVRVTSEALPYTGDCIEGSGEVPQDELGPWFEFDEADGELYDVLWPVLICLLESVLDLDPFVPLLAKYSKLGLLLTLSRSEGLKRPERLDISPPSSVVWLTPVLEPLVGGNVSVWSRGLT